MSKLGYKKYGGLQTSDEFWILQYSCTGDEKDGYIFIIHGFQTKEIGREGEREREREGVPILNILLIK